MKYLDKSSLAKYVFVVIAIGIAISFLIVSNNMAKDLAKEERQKIELWADVVQMTTAGTDNDELSIALKILSGNKTIPVILCDEDDKVLLYANIDVPHNDSIAFLKEKVAAFDKKNKPIVIENPDFKQYVYYGDSSTLRRLQYYPLVQIGVLTIFICVSFLALLSTKKAEQNKLWVGLSKETAHQLGTPISSLLAWEEYLKDKTDDTLALQEMEKDMLRLQVIVDRFSKIGSKPAPRTEEMRSQVLEAVGYLESRISKKVSFIFDMPENPVYANISVALFNWVIENLTKNAVDAMEGKGTITFKLSQKGNLVYLDITDTGKGMAKKMFKKIFVPGFSTKERGWGLGLSLTKRIIEDYHQGKVYVKNSELGVGTTFRIELKRVV